MTEATFPPANFPVNFPANFQEGQVPGGGSQLRYREAGAGEPVVILEGVTWGLWPLHQALAQRYRVIALDLPGFGGSPANHAARSSQDLAGAAAQAVAQLVPGGYTLIGTSFSANVALWLALQQPGSVDALLLISPTALRPTGVVIGASPEQRAAQLLAHPENGANLPPLDSATFAREQALVQQLGGNVNDADAEARLGEIACPTLVVFGSRDRLVAPAAGSLYRASIPTCNLSLVYDTGHLIAAERPQALLNAVADYVENRETFIVGRASGVINP